jgi:hypothetical protein
LGAANQLAEARLGLVEWPAGGMRNFGHIDYLICPARTSKNSSAPALDFQEVVGQRLEPVVPVFAVAVDPRRDQKVVPVQPFQDGAAQLAAPSVSGAAFSRVLPLPCLASIIVARAPAIRAGRLQAVVATLLSEEPALRLRRSPVSRKRA